MLPNQRTTHIYNHNNNIKIHSTPRDTGRIHLSQEKKSISHHIWLACYTDRRYYFNLPMRIGHTYIDITTN